MLIATNDTIYEWNRRWPGATQPRSFWTGGVVRALAVCGDCRMIGADSGFAVGSFVS